MADPHIRQTQMLTEVPDADLGQLLMSNVLWRMSATPGEIRYTGRPLGADTDEVLTGTGLRRGRGGPVARGGGDPLTRPAERAIPLLTGPGQHLADERITATSTISPSPPVITPDPSRSAASKAVTICSAWLTSAAVGVNTSLITGSWAGWIASGPETEPEGGARGFAQGAEIAEVRGDGRDRRGDPGCRRSQDDLQSQRHHLLAIGPGPQIQISRQVGLADAQPRDPAAAAMAGAASSPAAVSMSGSIASEPACRPISGSR